MSLSISVDDAKKFSRADTAGYYTLNKRPTDQFSQLLQLRAVNGHEARFPVAEAADLKSLATTVSVTGQAVSTAMPTFAKHVATVSHFAAVLEVDSAVPTRYGNAANLHRELVKVKVAAVLDRWRSMLVAGDAVTAGEFDGLVELATDASQQISAGANPEPNVIAAGNLEDIVTMLDPQGPQSGRYLVMNQDAAAKLWAGAYAGQIAWANHPVIGPTQMVSGVPVLIDNFIPNNLGTAGKTAIFAVLLEGDVRLEGIYPAAHAGREIRVDGPYAKQTQDTLAYTIEFSMGLAAIGQPVAMLDDITI